jgi:flagellar biogenesis protein FliO
MSGADQHVRVIGRCFLEPRRSVYLIQAGGRFFLVGVGDGPMSLLAEIDGSALPTARPLARASASPFADILTKMLGKGGR